MLRPKQRISTTAKMEGDWIKNNAFYYSGACIPAINERYADTLYRAANGEMDDSDYLYALNPLNSEKDKYKKFPSKMRNMDIISNELMMLMGEKRRRGLNYTVIARNSDLESIKKEIENGLAEKRMLQQIQNEYILQAQAEGQEIDMEQVEVMSMEQIKKQVSKVQDKVAIMGQNAMDYMRDYNELDSKFVENFLHFLITARAFTYRRIKGDEVEIVEVPPKEMRYLANSRIRFLEEAEAIERDVRMPINEVIDTFQGMDGFDEDVIRQLENRLGYEADQPVEKRNGWSERDSPENTGFAQMWSKISPFRDDRVYSDEEGVRVQHITWTSSTQCGMYKGKSILGEPIEYEVDEDFLKNFTLRDGETVDWKWVQQDWEVWILDDKHVVGGRPVPQGQGTYDKPYGIKKCYNGKIFNMKHVNPASIVSKGINFQIKYNLLHYYAEKIIAKNLDKIVIMPLSLIPEKEGMDMEASMYYAQAMGFLWVDDSNKNFATALNGIKVLNAELSTSLGQLWEYIRIVKQEWMELIGSTPQRKGQMNASDGKGVTENAMFRSSIMTEEIFSQFEDYQGRDLNYMLELSKFAFSEGKKSMFVTTDGKSILLDVDGKLHGYADYLVKVSQSGKDLQELEAAKSTAQALAQNSDGQYSRVIKLLRGNNISKLLEEMEIMEEEVAMRQEQATKAQQAHEQHLEEMKLKVSENMLEGVKYSADARADSAKEVATIKAETDLMSEFFNPQDQQAGDVAALESNIIKREEINSKTQLEREKIQADREKSIRDAGAKVYAADKTLQVAKENKQS